MTTFNFREPGEFGDGATMTEKSIAEAALAASPIPTAGGDKP